MNNFVKRFVLPAMIPFAFAACGKNADGTSKSPADVLNNAKDSVDQAAKDGALQNKIFAASCNTDLKDAAKSFYASIVGNKPGVVVIKSELTQYQFVGNGFTKATLLSPNTDCSDVALTVREKGKFEINEGEKTSDGGKSINLKFDSLAIEANSDAGVQLADEAVLCESGNWERSKERTVTGAAGKASCVSKALPFEVKEVYLVEGDTLLLGERGPLAQDGNRPERLDRNAPLRTK